MTDRLILLNIWLICTYWWLLISVPINLHAGYLPVDPEVVADRMGYLEQRYNELQELARLRRGRLDESLRLWQFFWDLADDENWIKEKQQIVSSTDIGHDLTTVKLLLNKHKVGQT